MKKLFTLLLSLTSLYTLSVAQSPVNLGFEEWIDFVVYKDPTAWGTLNFGAAFAQGFPVTAEQTLDAHSDSFAVKLTTRPSLIPLGGLGPFDHDTVPGLMVYGNIGSNEAGTAYTQRPTGVQFYYKYTPAYDDSAGFLVQLTKWSPVLQQQILVGQGAISLKDTVTTYTLGDVPVVYADTLTPDSLFIVMFSSFEAIHLIGSNLQTAIAKPGSTLFIDDVKLLGVVDTPNPTGLVDQVVAGISVKLYPNPATDNLTIQCTGYDFSHGALTLEMMDITGRRVQSLSLSSMQASADVSALPAGMYVYRLKDKQKVIKTGKVSIAR